VQASVRATRRATAIIAADEAAGAVGALEPEIECISVQPTRRALLRAIDRARERTPHGGLLPLVVIVPSHSADLIVLAAAKRVDRIAAYHGSGDSHRFAAAVRASFSFVDLTIVPGASFEADAIRAGADPSRVTAEVGGAIDRLLSEPPRRRLSGALKEMAASIALDAADAMGLLRLMEIGSPDRGVNVVNYHRVLPTQEIVAYCRPQMAVAEPLFEAQLCEIAQLRGFTPIDRLRAAASAGKVAITFDDGYEDNFRVALPIMQRFSTPACIFIVTNLIGHPEALWWDRLGLALFAYWRGGAAEPLPDALPVRARSIPAARSFEEVRAIISDLISELNGASNEARTRAVRAAESLVPHLSAGRTMLTWEEIAEMSRAGIYFGTHTQNHVPLDEVSREVAYQELSGSIRDLEARLDGSHAKALALPRGRMGKLTEGDLRGLGLEVVMTTEPGINAVGERSLFVYRRDGRMLTLGGRHHPAKLRLELTGIVDRLRVALNSRTDEGDYD
jgi:peptidoglycan/xylan/chitin deacetylase (PgdA/CDA1 family)